MSVYRLLATATEENLQAFHMAVCLSMNGIDRRLQTIRYTSFDVDMTSVRAAARRFGITLQRMFGAGTDETYELLTEGPLPAWPYKAEDLEGLIE